MINIYNLIFNKIHVVNIHEIKGNISSGSILCKFYSINFVSGWESVPNIQWNH